MFRKLAAALAVAGSSIVIPVAIATPAHAVTVTGTVPNMYEQITNRCYDYRYLSTQYVQLNPPYNSSVPSEVVKYVTSYHFCL